MGRETEKVRTGFYIEKEMLETADGLLAEESLGRLHAKCVDEVKRINGAVDFEDAYRPTKETEIFCL